VGERPDEVYVSESAYVQVPFLGLRDVFLPRAQWHNYFAVYHEVPMGANLCC
jgi:hypothetical protein